MNCTEAQLISPEVTSTEDAVGPVAILEQHLGVNYQQYYATFSHPTNDIALLQTPAGWGSVPGPYAYNRVGLSNSPASLMPFGFCLPGYLPASDATRPLACDCDVGQRQTDFGYHDGEMGGRLTTTPHNETAATSIHHQQHQLRQPSWATHQPSRLDAFDWRSFEDDSCECSTDQTECIPIAVSSSSPSPSPSSLSSSNDATMMAVASTSASQCADPVSESLALMTQSSYKRQSEGDRDGAFSPDGSSSFPIQQHRLFPPQGSIAHSPVPLAGGPLPVQIRLQEASLESSFDDGDDESSPSPSSGGDPFDRRRGSLGSRPGTGGGAGAGAGARDGAGCDAFNAGSRLGVLQADGAATGVPSQARRSSIACIPATTKGHGSGTAGGGDFQRPSAALDYESLKVKLEKLTGPVTAEGTRKDGAGWPRSLLDRRRTSIAAFPPHGYPAATAATGSTVSGADDHKTMARDSGVLSPDKDPHSAALLLPAKMDTTGTVNRFTDNSRLHHTISPNHLQESTNSVEPYDKNLSDDLSLTSSSSSSSTASSSCLLKFRLDYVIEQTLKNDARLQEIVRRHESERQNVQRKHRFQWMELEKSLTRNFGEEWRRFVATTPELSFDSTSPDGSASNDLHHRDFTDAAAADAGQQNRPSDEPKGTVVLNNQNITELETITEGLVEDPFAEATTESSFGQRRPSLMSGDFTVKPTGGGSNSELASRRYSEGNLNSYKRVKPRPIRRVVSKQHEIAKLVPTNGESIETTTSPCRNRPNTPNSLTIRQCPDGVPLARTSPLHRHATDTATSKTWTNNTEASQMYGLLQPVQNHQSCLQANIAARLSQMYTQNALRALLTANLLDANSPVYGFDPGSGLTGYGPNSFLPTGRPACAVQELDQQVLAFPWTAPYQNRNIHSLLGLHHYEEFM